MKIPKVPSAPKERRSAMWYVFGAAGLGVGLVFVDWRWAMPFFGLAVGLAIATFFFFPKPRPPFVPRDRDD